VKKNSGVKKKFKKFFFYLFKIFFLFKIPEFWYGSGKIPVKKNYIPGVKKKFKKKFFLVFFSKFFFCSKSLNFGMVAVKFW
jgi:hypothetical protein